MDIKQKIEKANDEAAHRLTSGEPVLVDIVPAREVIPGMKDKMITHAGPPLSGAACAAQCRARLSVWSSTKAGRRLPMKPEPYSIKARSTSNRTIIIRPSVQWRGRFRHPCRCGLWKTKPLATALTEATSSSAITASRQYKVCACGVTCGRQR